MESGPAKEGPHDSLWALQHLLETWAERARDGEIGRLIETLKAELRRRGYTIRCEVTRRQNEGRENRP
jgi:hypothetical protein